MARAEAESGSDMAHGIGIIGLGVMGERMLRAMEKHPGFEVVTVWDAAREAADKLQQISKRARFARDARDLAADPAVRCVYIAAPPHTHLDYAHLAFDHGKAVFTEKPLAVDVDAARDCASRVIREQHVAATNFPFASAPAVHAIASGIASGELGTIERIDIELAFARWPRAWQAPARWLAQRWEAALCARCCRISCS
jgi:predicted dehydrogenase